MRTATALSFVVSLALALAACGDGASRDPATADRTADAAPPHRDAAPRAAPPDSTPPPPATPPARSPLLEGGDLGGFTPSPEDAEQAQRLADPATRADVARELSDLPDERRAAILRAGLRLRDADAARSTVLRFALDDALDAWERRRAFGLAVSAAFDADFVPPWEGGGRVGIGSALEFASPEDLPALLAQIEAHPEVLGDDPESAGDLARPEHIPLLVRLTRSGDDRVRAFAWRSLGPLLDVTDAHRDEVAAALPADGGGPGGTADAPWVNPVDLAHWRARAHRDPRPATPDRDALLATLLAAHGDRPDVLAAVYDATARPGPSSSAAPEPWSDGIDVLIAGSDASWDLLVDAALSIPGCRTRRLAEAAAARLPDDGCPERLAREMGGEWGAFLETGARDLFVAKLRTWAGLSGDTTAAVRLLLTLGDERSVPRILAWAESERQSNFANVPWDDLGALRHPDVRVFLVRHVEENEDSQTPSVAFALQAIAAEDGLPPVAPWAWPMDAGGFAAVRRLVLAGRPVDAFAEALAHRPDEVVAGESQVRDPRVAAHLRRLRARRDLRAYPAATLELGFHGDRAALAESLDAIRAGRGAWLEAFDRIALGDAVRPETVAPWIDLLGGGGSPPREFLSTWFGWDPTQRDDGDPAPHDEVRGWWRRHGGRFVWSRLADRFVPAPR